MSEQKYGGSEEKLQREGGRDGDAIGNQDQPRATREPINSNHRDTGQSTGDDLEQNRAKGPISENYERQDNEEARKQRESELGTSFPSVIFGWLASLGAAPILVGIIGAIVAGIVALVGLGATGGGIASAVGFLITLFFVFLIGGYVAGRLAGRSGAKHGIFVALLALILVIILAVAGGILGSTFSNALSSAVPPSLTQNVPTSMPQGLGLTAIISGILTLIVPFLGGALGGSWGAKRTDRAQTNNS